MHRHDGHHPFTAFDGGANSRVRVRHVQVEVLRSAIDQERVGVEIAHHFGRRGEGHGRDHDRIALFHAHRFQGEVEGGGAGVDGDGMGMTEVAGELVFELFDARAGGEPAALERSDDLVDFLRTEAGLKKGDFHRKAGLKDHGTRTKSEIRSSKSETNTGKD
jgi:hypothetical protein